MEFRVLKYFLTVAREENMTRAAEALYITQPTLSRQIAELEEELGTPLFVRGQRSVTLTDAGVLLRRRFLFVGLVTCLPDRSRGGTGAAAAPWAAI